MSRAWITVRSDNDGVLLNFTIGGKGMTAKLTFEEAAALGTHLLDVAKKAAAAGAPVAKH